MTHSQRGGTCCQRFEMCKPLLPHMQYPALTVLTVPTLPACRTMLAADDKCVRMFEGRELRLGVCGHYIPDDQVGVVRKLAKKRDVFVLCPNGSSLSVGSSQIRSAIGSCNAAGRIALHTYQATTRPNWTSPRCAPPLRARPLLPVKHTHRAGAQMLGLF